MATISKTSSLRVLVLAPRTSESSIPLPSPFPGFLEQLTGTAPSPEISSFSGYTSHAPIQLRTKYYEKEVSIWCDELPPPDNITVSTTRTTTATKEDDNPKGDQTTSTAETLSTWMEQMTSTNAREVRDVIGAIILILPWSSKSILTKSSDSLERQIAEWTRYIEPVNGLRDLIEDETGREVGSLIVLQDFDQSDISDINIDTDRVSDTLLASLEDECLSVRGVLGWDFVSINDSNINSNQESNTATTPAAAATTIAASASSGRNEYGEKMGFSRVVEVLQGVNWSAPTNAELDEDDDDADDENNSSDVNGMDMSFLDDINLSSLKHHAFPTNDLRPEHEVQREMMEMKMAMLGMDSTLDHGHDHDDDNDMKDANDHDDNDDDADDSGNGNGDGGDDDFGAMASAELSKQKSTRNNDDDVWTALDDNEVQALQVSQLQGLMDRVVSIREAGSEMSRADREKFAKREISRLMKEL